MGSTHQVIPPSTVSTRQFIDDYSTLDQFAVQWSLYLQAMNRILEAPADPKNPYTYYSLAGIHGWPNVTWPYDDKTQPGYCAHSRAIFLAWHRMYVVQFDQQIIKVASELAGSNTDLQQEAEKIRQPFWDWARKAALPNVAIRERVSVVDLNDYSKRIEISNPLHSYTFTGPLNYRSPYNALPVTTRFDDANTLLEAKNLRQAVFSLLLFPSEYGPFSNKGHEGRDADGEWIWTGSLETIHDNVHISVSEFFNDPPMTSWDPLFWPHHSSIDRLYAFWQTLNPEMKFQENPDHMDHSYTPLEPFMHQNGGYWTTAMFQTTETGVISDTFKLGYQYPETGNDLPLAQRQARVRLALFELYGDPIVPGTGYPHGAVDSSHVNTATCLKLPDGLPENFGIRREWRARVAVRKNLVVDNFTLYFFLGPLESDVVGSITTFKRSTEECANCKQHEADFMYGVVGFTDKLSRKLPGVKLDDKLRVEAWLMKNFHWKIILEKDKTEIPLPPSQSKSLIVSVESFQLTYPKANDDGTVIVAHDLGTHYGLVFNRADHPEATQGIQTKD